MATHESDVRGRDNFSEVVKQRLAAEVGHRCSLPQCGIPTIGPSSTEPKGTSNSGVAAHITAAADGGPRFDGSLTPAERSSHENGIWCCAKHARMIDNDPTGYTAAQLRLWKAQAIDLQNRAHTTGDVDPNGAVKIQRAAQDGIARRAMRASLRCRATIMSLVTLADTARNVRRMPSHQVPALNAAMEHWTAEYKAVSKETEDVLMDIRVQWGTAGGEPPGLTALINLLSYLEEWRLKFIDEMNRTLYQPHTPRPNYGPCDWSKVFSGDHGERNTLQRVIDAESSVVEAWAHGFIAGRPT